MPLNEEEEAICLSEGDLLTAPSQTQSAVINREMNDQAIPPINKLPTEVLANIMQIVVSRVPRCGEDDSRLMNGSVPRYPDALSHVCSRWRQVAVHSRSLWSHVDITDWNTSGSRAMSFFDRAGQSPLRLHLVVHINPSKPSNNPVDLVPFLAPITSQLGSLELTPRIDDLSKTHTSTLSICLAICASRNLTELVLRIVDGYRISVPIFIKARDHVIGIATPTDEFEPIWVDMDIPEERLEGVLRGITILRLTQVYPQWTSSAYCGLVELRLLAGMQLNTDVPESQFVSILRSSPQLRILHFNLGISDFVSLDTAIVDLIILQDLEVLNLDWMQEDGIEIFFRWLAPAPNLSQFSFRPFSNDVDFGHPAIESFLAGSNITMLHTNFLYLRELIGLTSLLRHIRVLALENFELEGAEEIAPSRFDTLYLLESKLQVDTLRQLIQSNSVQRVIIYRSTFYHGLSVFPPDPVPAVLLDVCSDISMLPRNGPDPIEGWEVFWHK